MACTSVLTIISHEEPILATTTSSLLSPTSDSKPVLRHRRRHSSYNPRSWAAEYDDVQLLVDRFLAELGRRLDFLEKYGQINPDSGIGRAFANLCMIRESCAQISDDIMGAGQRRAKVLVDILEEQYKGALARKETMEAKVQEGIAIMDSMLAKYESLAYAVRDSKLAAASELFDSGWRRMDSGLTHASDLAQNARLHARWAKDVLRVKIEAAVQLAKQHGLIRYEDLPDPWKCNPHILGGYRFNTAPADCLKSLLSPSNEFFNIWSHLLGLLLILTLALYVYPHTPTFTASSRADIAIAAAFFLAAAKCLVCSTIWHTFSSISEQALMERFACVDYTGISLLVATSILTTEYTAFYCAPLPRWSYMLATIALGVAGSIAPWHPDFNRADRAWLRVAFYVSLAATGFLPVGQLALQRGVHAAVSFYAPIAKSIAVYLAGALLYASKIPERWWPGCFDYVGGSHNIWHVAVVGGIIFHYMAMQEFFAKAFAMAGGEGQCSVY